MPSDLGRIATEQGKDLEAVDMPVGHPVRAAAVSNVEISVVRRSAARSRTSSGVKSASAEAITNSSYAVGPCNASMASRTILMSAAFFEPEKNGGQSTSAGR